jgi:hypothetical protein
MSTYSVPTVWVSSMIAALMLLFGCNKQDKESPSILHLNTESTAGLPTTQFEAGEAMVVHVIMEDNQLLSQLKITLTGMEGQGLSTGFVSESGFYGDWIGSNISLLEGTNADKKIHLTLNDTIQGWWTIEAVVLDDSGRLSEVRSIDIEVSNQNAPQIDINAVYPTLVDNSWIVSAGESLKVLGSISDASGLASTEMRLLNAAGSVLGSSIVEHNGFTTFSLSELDYNLPSTISGDLILEFESIDMEGFGSVFRYSMHVID